MIEIKKIERFWVVFIRREDGTVNDYRFNSKREANAYIKRITPYLGRSWSKSAV